MKTFYVSFGLGTLLRDFYAVIEASEEGIVRAWMDKHYRRLWANIYDAPPAHGRPINKRPEQLHYLKAEHV